MPFGQVIPVTNLNLGFPGRISELGDPLPIAKPVLGTTPHNIAFGAPVVVIPNASGGGDTVQSVADFIAGGGTFTAAKFGGVAISNVKVQFGYPSNPDVPQVGSYAPNETCNFLVRGTVDVVINNGTPASQGTVYVRVAANASLPNTSVGDFEAAADGTNTVALTGVVFRNGNLVDANNVFEITILERVAA